MDQQEQFERLLADNNEPPLATDPESKIREAYNQGARLLEIELQRKTVEADLYSTQKNHTDAQLHQLKLQHEQLKSQREDEIRKVFEMISENYRSVDEYIADINHEITNLQNSLDNLYEELENFDPQAFLNGLNPEQKKEQRDNLEIKIRKLEDQIRELTFLLEIIRHNKY